MFVLREESEEKKRYSIVRVDHVGYKMRTLEKNSSESESP